VEPNRLRVMTALLVHGLGLCQHTFKLYLTYMYLQQRHKSKILTRSPSLQVLALLYTSDILYLAIVSRPRNRHACIDSTRTALGCNVIKGRLAMVCASYDARGWFVSKLLPTKYTAAWVIYDTYFAQRGNSINQKQVACDSITNLNTLPYLYCRTT